MPASGMSSSPGPIAALAKPAKAGAAIIDCVDKCKGWLWFSMLLVGENNPFGFELAFFYKAQRNCLPVQRGPGAGHGNRGARPGQ